MTAEHCFAFYPTLDTFSHVVSNLISSREKISLTSFSGADECLCYRHYTYLIAAEIISDLATLVTLTANCLFSCRFLSLTQDCLLTHRAILLRIWIATEAVVTMASESESLSAVFRAFFKRNTFAFLGWYSLLVDAFVLLQKQNYKFKVDAQVKTQKASEPMLDCSENLCDPN